MKKLMVLSTLIMGFSLNAATASQSSSIVKVITKSYWPSHCSNNPDRQENCSNSARVICSKQCPANNRKCSAPVACSNGQSKK